MPTYRLFFMEDDGQASGFLAFKSEDEAQAREAAEERRDGHPAELWSGNRLIARFKADQNA